MDILTYGFMTFFAGVIVGLACARFFGWLDRVLRGKYMGTVTAVTGSAVYVDNWER